jgi:hypothetical protein
METIKNSIDETAVAEFREALIARDLLPARHDDFHKMRRCVLLIIGVYCQACQIRVDHMAGMADDQSNCRGFRN